MTKLSEELKQMAAFYGERPSINQEWYAPRSCEISKRECADLVSILSRAAEATAGQDIEGWITKNFGGRAAAVRREDDPPLPGEPFMSLVDAKDLVRQAVAAFSPAAGSCPHCYGTGLRNKLND